MADEDELSYEEYSKARAAKALDGETLAAILLVMPQELKVVIEGCDCEEYAGGVVVEDGEIKIKRIT